MQSSYLPASLIRYKMSPDSFSCLFLITAILAANSPLSTENSQHLTSPGITQVLDTSAVSSQRTEPAEILFQSRTSTKDFLQNQVKQHPSRCPRVPIDLLSMLIVYSLTGTSPPILKPKTKGLLQELTRTILPRGASSAPAAGPALPIHMWSCCREQEKQEKISSGLKN